MNKDNRKMENKKLEKKPKKEKITLSKIFHLNLIAPIILEKKEENKKNKKKFSIYYKPFNIYATGSTFDNSLKDFQEQLYLLYKFYAVKEDQDLTRGSRILKQKILKLVKIEA